MKRIEGRVLELAKIGVLNEIVDAIANCFNQCKIKTSMSMNCKLQMKWSRKIKESLQNRVNNIQQLYYTNPMDINVFLNHPNEQQAMLSSTEEETIAAIRQKERVDNPKDDCMKIQKVSLYTCLKS